MIRARAIGNAVFLEHSGNCGDIASFAMETPEAAEFVAGQIEKALDRTRQNAYRYRMLLNVLHEAGLPGWEGESHVPTKVRDWLNSLKAGRA